MITTTRLYSILVVIQLAFLAGCADPDHSSHSIGYSDNSACCIAYYREGNSIRDNSPEMGIAVWDDGFVVTMFRSKTGALVADGRAAEREIVDLVRVFRQSSLTRGLSKSFGVPDGPSYMLYLRTNQKVFDNYWDEITNPNWGAFASLDDARFREFYEFAVDWWRIQMLLVRLGRTASDRIEDPDAWKELTSRTGAADVGALFLWLRRLPQSSER